MFRRIWSLIKKEFLAIWKDPKSRSLIIIPPLLQLFVFANAITMEIKNIDFAVLDRSQSVESRELISRFENSVWFRKIIYLNNEKDVKHHIETQKVQGAIEISNDFASAIHAKKPVTVQIIVDGRQTNTASIINNYASQIISDYSSELSPPERGAIVNASVRNWFNPNLEYLWFLLVSLITMLALMISVLLTAMSIARERELGTFDQLIVSPLSSFEILVGKTVPPLCIALILTLFMTFISVTVFKIPFVGSLFWFLVSTFTALLSIVGVGLFISSLCKTQQQAILGVFTFQMPAVLLSGFVSPVEDMPAFFQFIDIFNPVKYFMILSKGIFLKGMAVPDIISNLIPLILSALFTLTLAGRTFKRKLD